MEEQQILEKLHKEKEYRPTMVAILYKIDKEKKISILFVQSSKNKEDYWGLPQGGIDEGEKIETCFKRELEEELNLRLNEFSNIKINNLSGKLDAEKQRKDKRGFSKGKHYFFCFAKCNKNKEINFNKQEIRNAKWIKQEELENYLLKSRPERATLNKKALDLLFNKLSFIEGLPNSK